MTPTDTARHFDACVTRLNEVMREFYPASDPDTAVVFVVFRGLDHVEFATNVRPQMREAALAAMDRIWREMADAVLAVTEPGVTRQ